MTAYSVTVQADSSLQGTYSEALERAAHLTLELEGAPDGSEVTIVLTGAKEIRRLNREYRGVDSETDVLSFEMNETLPGGGQYLGDVVIAMPVAVAQAAAQGHELVAELSLLTIHGVLHLLGEDHGHVDEKMVMWEKQSAVLANLNLRANPSES